MMLSRNFLLACVVMGVVLGLHYLIFQFGLDNYKTYFESIYLFISLLFVITLSLIQIIEKIYKEQLGYFFLVIVALKLGAAKIFLNSIPEWQEPVFKFSFLGLYLISLILITWFTARILLKSEN